MIKFGKIKSVVLHFVGNKFNGEGVKISNECLNFAPVKKDLAALVSSAFDMKELYSFKNIKASEVHNDGLYPVFGGNGIRGVYR